MFEKIRRIGWAAVEAGLILVFLAVLLSILLGKDGGIVVTSIASNATSFLQSLPAGTLVGLIAIGALYLLLRGRVRV
ncbi:MAG TPA: hypothetical protein VGG27_07775 [Magnetospirillaceae bacterium]|jgi:hypothetical protein